jgi:hypothetical protein
MLCCIVHGKCSLVLYTLSLLLHKVNIRLRSFVPPIVCLIIVEGLIRIPRVNNLIDFKVQKNRLNNICCASFS